METVRVGIIGVGGMGGGHAAYLAGGEVPHATLAAVADSAPAALDRVKQRYGDGIARYESGEELIASGKVDGIIVATPHYFHPPLAIAGMRAGLAVLSEKPAGVYVKQVKEMNAVAEETGAIFGLMFNQRTLPIHQKLRELVQSGEIGEIRRTQYVITNWFRTQAYYDSGGWRATWAGEGGGVLVNQAPHNLDLFQWICGLPTRVRAFCGFGRYHDIEVEDDVTAYLEYANGATGTFVTSTGEAPGTSFLEIVGDRGKLLLQNDTLTFWRTRVPVPEFLKSAKGGFERPETWTCDIPTSARDNGSHKQITTNWCNAIRGAEPLKIPGVEGVNGVQLANAMHLSAWTDSWASVPTDEELYWKLLQEKIASGRTKAETGKALDFSGTFKA